MSHKVDTMAYAGQVPWHGLGTKLPAVATSEEALAAAGMDWRVEKFPAYAKVNEGTFVQVKDRFAIVRTDHNKPLGVVGSRYTPLQNRDAFKFFDAIVGVKEAIYHTAGSLNEGRRVWILAKLDGVVRIIGDDVCEKYLLLSNSHDGTTAVNMMFTPTRVVCANTLNVAMRSGQKKFYMRHSASIGNKVVEVREQLGILNQQFSMFEDQAQALQKVQFHDQAFDKLLDRIGFDLKITDGVKRQQASTRQITNDKNLAEKRNLMKHLYQSGAGTDIPGVRGTAWGAFNAVTEFIDHHLEPKGKENRFEKKTKSLLYGAGAAIKQDAWNNLVGAA